MLSAFVNYNGMNKKYMHSLSDCTGTAILKGISTTAALRCALLRCAAIVSDSERQ